MYNIIVFENKRFGNIRTFVEEGKQEPWFVAADVCRALEVKNARDAVARLDDDEKNTVVLTDGNRGNPNVTVVSEPGLYALVLSSRNPEAKEFKRWITHDVIPSIRKSGGYIAGQEDMSDADLMAKALIVAQRQIEQRDKQITEMQPKALFADAVSASKTSILVNEMAKLLQQNGVKIGEKKLFKLLRVNGFVQQRRASQLPDAKSYGYGTFRDKGNGYHNVGRQRNTAANAESDGQRASVLHQQV